MNTFNVQNILNRHSTFRTANIVSKTSINENFIIYISLLKNKAYQTYNLNIVKSSILNNHHKRLLSGDYIKLTEYVDQRTVWNCFLNSQTEFLAWLTEYARQLPGFDKFDAEDFQTIVDSSLTLLLGVQISEFVQEHENYAIFQHIQLCRKRMWVLFGKMFTSLLIEFHRDLNNLKLTDYELSLFYPFALLSCNGNNENFFLS